VSSDHRNERNNYNDAFDQMPCKPYMAIIPVNLYFMSECQTQTSNWSFLANFTVAISDYASKVNNDYKVQHEL